MTPEHIRTTRLPAARHVVVKLGTQLLTGDDGHLDVAYFALLAGQLAALSKRQVRVTVVSSGAIGAGCAELGLAKRPADITGQQAVAAIGQRRLMTHYAQALAPHGLKVAQLLLTRDDFDHRLRFLNIRNCVNRLHDLGCVPVVNENDTVAVDELRFGDNDLLAALMCNAVQAQALVLLTNVDGLLDEHGRRVETVADHTAAAALARSEHSPLGTGGISSKLEAARLVTEAGEPVVIAGGREPDVLVRLLQGENLGTLFLPAHRKLDSRSRWIGLTRRPRGKLSLDAGAVAALTQRGKSLLAMGVTAVEGDFEEGDVVALLGPEQKEIGRGLTNYAAPDLKRIMGHKTSQYQEILGHPSDPEVVHRDNLVVKAE